MINLINSGIILFWVAGFLLLIFFSPFGFLGAIIDRSKMSKKKKETIGYVATHIILPIYIVVLIFTIIILIDEYT